MIVGTVVALSFILFLQSMNEVYDELRRQFSSSQFREREMLKFRRCAVVFFCLTRKIRLKIFHFLTFGEFSLIINLTKKPAGMCQQSPIVGLNPNA